MWVTIAVFHAALPTAVLICGTTGCSRSSPGQALVATWLGFRSTELLADTWPGAGSQQKSGNTYYREIFSPTPETWHGSEFCVPVFSLEDWHSWGGVTFNLMLHRFLPRSLRSSDLPEGEVCTSSWGHPGEDSSVGKGLLSEDSKQTA